MNGEEDFRLENTEETERSQYDFCVLLLDSDATCLVNLSEMLRKRGYRVVATTRADEVPLIINNKDEKIDLLLAESRLIEMNKYQLLDEIRSISEIPVVVAGANVDNDVISDGLCRGVQFYMKKPLMESDLDYLSQFIISIRRQQDLLTQSLGDELNQNIKNMKGEKEDLDEYKGESVELGDQKMPDLTCPEMQNEFKETDDDQLSQGKKRKDNVDTDAEEHAKTDLGDLGDQKKPKLVRAGDLQNETSGDIPNEGEANNEGKEPTEIKKNEEENVNSEFEIKEKPEMVSMEGELEKWSTQPITDLASYVHYEFQEGDFQPLESVGESAGHQEIPLSPKESSNKNIAAQTNKALDVEEPRQDGISLADLEFDLQEGQGSTADLDKEGNQELFNEIFTDLAKELKP